MSNAIIPIQKPLKLITWRPSIIYKKILFSSRRQGQSWAFDAIDFGSEETIISCDVLFSASGAKNVSEEKVERMCLLPLRGGDIDNGSEVSGVASLKLQTLSDLDKVSVSAYFLKWGVSNAVYFFSSSGTFGKHVCKIIANEFFRMNREIGWNWVRLWYRNLIIFWIGGGLGIVPAVLEVFRSGLTEGI